MVETTVSQGHGRAAKIWIVLAVLIAIAIGVEVRDRSTQQATSVPAGPSMLMPAPIDEMSAIEIAYDNNLHRFARDDQGMWFYHGVHAGAQANHEHVPDPAMSDKIAASLSALGRARIERQLDPIEGDPFGVTRPVMIIIVFLPDRTESAMQYAVGDLAPDDLSRYVQVVSSKQVLTIPHYQIQNLIDLITAVSAQPAPESASAS